MQRVHVTHHFTQAPQRVYDFLSEHENLGALFGLKVERLNDGTDGTRNGVGSARKLSVAGVAPFVETVTEAVPGARIVYEITKGSPLKGHRGVLDFKAAADGGTDLDYVIDFGGKLPGADVVVAAALRRSIPRGLAKAAREA